MTRFISFEGGEGAGKTTLIQSLSQVLNQRHVPHILSREPGGTLLAENLRQEIVRNHERKPDPIIDCLLLFAGRRDHVEQLIKPALADGSWVLCDRFYHSTYAYQGAALGLDSQVIDYIRHISIGNFKPDLTFYLDVSPEIGLARSQGYEKGEDRFEGMNMDLHRKLRAAYLSMAKADPVHFIIINANQSPEQVLQEVQAVLSKNLGLSL